MVNHVHRARAGTSRALQRQVNLVPTGMAVVAKLVLRLNQQPRGGASQHAGQRVALDHGS